MTETKRELAKQSITWLLEHLGENPARPGLVDTPDRVVRALEEMTAGRRQDPAEILSARFEADYDQMVVLRGVRFTSLCEHHLLPFIGEASVGYIPRGRVVGLSKLARLVHCYARRLQIQEQMTTDIAQALQTQLEPVGVGVIVRAEHQCMACRGVRADGAEMVTSALLGRMRADAEVRAEFMGLVG